MRSTLRLSWPLLAANRARGRGRRLVERNAMVYRRTWMIIVSGFFEPLFYLLAIGVGVGELVGGVTVGGVEVDYRTFVAPALLASSAMNGAVFDSTFNIFHKLRYAKVYDAVLATPLQVRDVAVGEVTWALIRGQLYAMAFLVVMLAMGLVGSWWAVLAPPGCALVGFCFASLGLALTARMRSWADFEWVSVGTVVLFLFSATFYPLSISPGWVQVLTQLSPLYHGVALTRGLLLGTPGWAAVGHAVVLAVVGAVAFANARARLVRLLVT